MTMTDHEVERALGYTPCVCGVIDGTWHWRCYRGKTDAELKAGIALAFRNARRHLKKQRAEALRVACGKTPNVKVTGFAPTDLQEGEEG